MPIQIYALLTWTTRDRAPVIGPEVEEFLGRALPAIARRHGAHVIELGVVPDHVHVLLSLPTKIDFPTLVQSLKGATARIANRDGIARGERLRWATGYDLRTVSPGRALARVRQYVAGQKAHHGVEGQ